MRSRRQTELSLAFLAVLGMFWMSGSAAANETPSPPETESPRPCILNVDLQQSEPGRIVVTYDLASPRPAAVRLIGSADGGRAFSMRIETVQGDVGEAVVPGAGRRIVWEHKADYPEGLDGIDVMLDVVADYTQVPTYALIPVRGRLGAEVTAVGLISQLDAAAAAGAQVIVLEIQSPGGRHLALEKVLPRIADLRGTEEIRVVGLVRHQGLHAAALLALSLDAVYLLPRAEFGGAGDAEAWPETPIPEDVPIYPLVRHAVLEAAAKVGRDPLLVKAVLGPTRDVYVCGAGEALGFTEKPWESKTPCRLLTGAGGRLRMVGPEAVSFGLADGVVAGLEELGAALGYTRWVPLQGEPMAPPLSVGKAEVQRARVDVDFLLADLGDALTALRAGEPRQVTLAVDLVAQVRRCAEELEQIREDYPQLSDLIDTRAPAAPGSLVSACEEELRAIQRHRRRFKY